MVFVSAFVSLEVLPNCPVEHDLVNLATHFSDLVATQLRAGFVSQARALTVKKALARGVVFGQAMAPVGGYLELPGPTFPAVQAARELRALDPEWAVRPPANRLCDHLARGQ